MAGTFACDMIELPESKISKEPIFNSEVGLKLYTNSFYETFPNAPALYTNSYYIAVNSVIKYFTKTVSAQRRAADGTGVPFAMLITLS